MSLSPRSLRPLTPSLPQFGGTKGVAALYVRRAALPRVGRMLRGGGQERGMRAGTESTVLLAGLGAAAQVTLDEGPAIYAHMAALRRRLLEGLRAGLAGHCALRVNGPEAGEPALPNTLSVGLVGVRADALLAALRDSVCASASAACHSHEAASVSAVLRAMDVPLDAAIGTLRLSVGRHTTVEEVDEGVRRIVAEARGQLAK